MKPKAKSIVALVVVVGSLGLAACGGSRSAAGIKVKDLTGLWKYEASFTSGVFLQLNEDGTHSVAAAPAWIEQAPSERRQFQLEGTLLTFTTSSESWDSAGQSGSYQIELIEPDQLQFVLQEDSCQVRANETEGIWSRYEP